MVATAVLIFTVACAGVGAAYAAESGGKSNPMGDLVAAISQKFNLPQAEVQKVFDEQRTRMQTLHEKNRQQNQAERRQEFESRLSALVSSGKLTQVQADAIKARESELRTWREAQMAALENKTGQDRKTAMEALREAQKTKMEELKQWAKSNGIDQNYLPLCGMVTEGRGIGRRGGGFGGPEAK